jgi:hypothetical protein
LKKNRLLYKRKTFSHGALKEIMARRSRCWLFPSVTQKAQGAFLCAPAGKIILKHQAAMLNRPSVSAMLCNL